LSHQTARDLNPTITKYPPDITIPLTYAPGPSSAPPRKPTHGTYLATSTRRSGKFKQPNRRPSPNPPKSSFRHKPKRVSQVDEHDSEHVGEHEEHDEQDDNKSSEGDAQVDFATNAVSYSTIDTRHNISDSYDDAYLR